MSKEKKTGIIDRRTFLKYLGAGTALTMAGCSTKKSEIASSDTGIAGTGELTYRINPNTGD